MRARLIVAAPVAICHLLLFIMLATPARQPWRVDLSLEPPVTALLLEPVAPPARPDVPGGAPGAPALAAPESPPRPNPARPAIHARPSPAQPTPDAPPLADAPTGSAEPGVILGEGALAGALAAGSGGGGGCDMVRRLQDALRADPDIRAAVTRSHRALGAGGKAILVWNGEWLRSPGQEGKGLAGVRQAIAMEVAFAPDACRAQRVRGLVVIAFDDGPGAARLALGADDWRWTELLSARR